MIELYMLFVERKMSPPSFTPRKPTRAIRGSITSISRQPRDSRLLSRLRKLLVTRRMPSFLLLRSVFEAASAFQVSILSSHFLE